jgi:hypothetical protein
MNEFKIKSVESDLVAILSDIKGDYFKIRIESAILFAEREVWAYTDSYFFADLLETLASYEKPWKDTKSWESIEGELKVSAECSKLGQVSFSFELSDAGRSEEWVMKTVLVTELGQLPKLAKSARAFFGNSPS